MDTPKTIIVNNEKELKALRQKYHFVFVPSSPGGIIEYPTKAIIYDKEPNTNKL